MTAPSDDLQVADDLQALARAVRLSTAGGTAMPCPLSDRLVAAALDLAVLFVLLLLVVGAVEAVNVVLEFERTHSSLFVSCMLLALALGALAYSAMEVAWAATPGKRVMDLQIARAQGQPATAAQRLLRWGIKQLPLFALAAWAALACMANLRATPWILRAGGLAPRIVLLIAGLCLLGQLLALFPGRQPLHDRLARTAVFYSRDLRRVPPPQPFAVLPHDGPRRTADPAK